MPLPTFISDDPPPAGTGGRVRPYVFISYAHHDARLAAQFHANWLMYARKLGLNEEDVYFDSENVRAGDQWPPGLQAAVERANVVIFLVSLESLRSKYCMQFELPVAVQRGALVVPVILKSSPWTDQPIAGTGTTLGEFQAAPIRKNREVVPIEKWKFAAEAWTTTLTQIEAALRARFQIDDGTPARHHRRIEGRFVPHIAHRCDQTPTWTTFKAKLADWQDRTLVVLAKGLYDDELLRFWNRLEHDILSAHLAGSGQRCLRQHPLELPSIRYDPMPEADLRRHVHGELGDALALTAAQSTPGLCLITASLPMVDGVHDLGPLLHALFDYVEQHERPDLMCAHALVLMVEDPQLQSVSLTTALGLERYQRTFVMELLPLRAINEEDVRHWFRNERIEEVRPHLQEGDLIEQLNKARERRQWPELRLRHFRNVIDPLIS